MAKRKFILVKAGGDAVARLRVPVPRYTSMAQALDSFSSLSNRWRKNGCSYPCLVCGGDGWYRKIEDRDPVEGYKLAPSYDCESCKGTGGGTKEQFKAHYDTQVKHDKEQIAQFQAQLETFTQALSLLTPDQVKIMKKMLGQFDTAPQKDDSVKTITVKN